MRGRGVLDVSGGSVKSGEDLDIVVGNVCGLVNVSCTSDHVDSMSRAVRIGLSSRELEEDVSGYKLGSVRLSRSPGLSSTGT